MKLKEEDNVFGGEGKLKVEPHESNRKKQRKCFRGQGEPWELMMGRICKGEGLLFGQCLKSISSAEQ